MNCLTRMIFKQCSLKLRKNLSNLDFLVLFQRLKWFLISDLRPFGYLGLNEFTRHLENFGCSELEFSGTYHSIISKDKEMKKFIQVLLMTVIFHLCRGIQLPFRGPDFQKAIFLLSHHHLHTWMHVGHCFLGKFKDL